MVGWPDVSKDGVIDVPAGSPERGDGQAVVLGRPGDNCIRGQGQAPHLPGLLLVVPSPERSLAGVGERPTERVQVLALVQLAADPPPVRLVSQVPGGVDGSPERPVLLDRGGERVLLPAGRAHLADHWWPRR